jgi:hypothetical protein
MRLQRSWTRRRHSKEGENAPLKVIKIDAEGVDGRRDGADLHELGNNVPQLDV